MKANTSKTHELERTNMSLLLELKRESILRKKAYNQIREMKGNIRVLARVRPALTGGEDGEVIMDGAQQPLKPDACIIKVSQTKQSYFK